MDRVSGWFVVLSSIASILVGCSHAGAPLPSNGGIAERGACEEPGPPGRGWRDLGEVRADATPTSVVVLHGEVLVGTTSGLYRRPVDGTGGWRRSGLDGLSVAALHLSHRNPGLVVAGIMRDLKGSPLTEPPIRVSRDAGWTWQVRGEGFRNELESTAEPRSYDPVHSLTSFVRPSGAEVYFANTDAASVARSTDLATWRYISGGPGQFGYHCLIHAPPGDGHVYQGCELPLDSAWVKRFDVDKQPSDGTDDEEIVGTDRLGNRRPNLVTSVPTVPTNLLVGVEGGLFRYGPQGMTWIYRSEGGDDPAERGYSYVRMAWSDPSDPRHLLFGGPLNGDNSRLQLYETFDGGGSVARIEAPCGIAFSEIWIEAGTSSPRGDSLTLAVTLTDSDDRSRAHVLVRELRALESNGLEEGEEAGPHPLSSDLESGARGREH